MTIQLAKNNPESEFFGWDFAESMINAANSLKKSEGIQNVTFSVVDSKGSMPEDFVGAFDMVMTKRMLINLKGAQKHRAISNIKSILKAGGQYVMVECFKEPLDRTNARRELLGLKKIDIHHFNEYLDTSFLEDVKNQIHLLDHIDFESEYYYISRVYNAALSNGSPSYDAEINKIAAKLSAMKTSEFSGFAPEQIYVFKK